MEFMTDEERICWSWHVQREKRVNGYGGFMVETWEEERKKVRGEDWRVSVKREKKEDDKRICFEQSI
jgi:hypothetical protein